MQKFKKLITGFITFVALFAITPITAHAEWKSDNKGWWYTEGSSYDTGWKLIDSNWYYFYSDGYMATNTKIDGCYLDSDGVWTNSVPATTSYSNNSGNSSASTSSNYSGDYQSQTVYVSNNGIYHSSPHAHGMKYYTTMTRAEAEAKGYRACEKCY